MLSAQQKRFVTEYLQTPVGVDAARAAGYSERSIRAIAHQLLNNPEVQAAIAEGQAKLAKRHEITVDRVLQELAAIGFANLADFLVDGRINLANITRAQYAAVAEVTVDTVGENVVRTKLKLHDKRAALVDLGKHLGLFRPAPIDPFADQPDAEDAENVPIRDSARALLFALATAMKGQAGQAAKPATPTKH